jgi:hypothetical protein
MRNSDLMPADLVKRDPNGFIANLDSPGHQRHREANKLKALPTLKKYFQKSHTELVDLAGPRSTCR